MAAAFSIQFQTQITAKRLGFINDVDLRNDLQTRLEELDRVVLANANYSTVFLAIGAIEGIFKHVAEIYKSEIRSSQTYPRTGKTQTPKRFEELSIEELYVELKALDIAPQTPDYSALYKLFRQYRNCIHPQAQVQKSLDIELGQAQMALGLLNATILNLDQNVFVGKHIFEKVAGAPQYDSHGVLHLQMDRTPHHSFVVLRGPVSDKLSFTFDLRLSPNALFNFVFNYGNEGDFKMVRLDSRPVYVNSVLRSLQKYSWSEYLWANPSAPPTKEQFPVAITIDIPRGVFDFVVDGMPYTFRDDKQNSKLLSSEIRPRLRVGFFNEVNSVELSNINIQS